MDKYYLSEGYDLGLHNYNFIPYSDQYSHSDNNRCRCNPYSINIFGYIKKKKIEVAFIKFIENNEYEITAGYNKNRMFNPLKIDNYVPVLMEVYVHNIGRLSFTKSTIKGETNG